MAQFEQVGRFFSGLNVRLAFGCISLSCFFSDHAFAWADVRVASVRRAVASPVVSLDQRTLGRISDDMRASMAPVYAVSADGEEASELVGLRDSHVWRVSTVGRAISMERLGAAIDTADKRVRDAEVGVLGARAILAYEDPSEKVLVTVLSAGNALYMVHQSGGAFSIVRIGAAAE